MDSTNNSAFNDRIAFCGIPLEVVTQLGTLCSHSFWTPDTVTIPQALDHGHEPGLSACMLLRGFPPSLSDLLILRDARFL